MNSNETEDGGAVTGCVLVVRCFFSLRRLALKVDSVLATGSCFMFSYITVWNAEEWHP